MARILITSAIPYINGIKHLGNLVGSQLPADLHARYHRARGNEVMFLCATDEHGTPAELAAAKAGQPVVAKSCTNPVTMQYNIGQQLGISGTPAIFAADGTQLGGYLPPAQLKAALEKLPGATGTP